MWGQTLLHSQKIQHPIEGVLLQKTRENQSMVKYTDKYKEVSGQGGDGPPPHPPKGAEGWGVPGTCGRQACPDLVLRSLGLRGWPLSLQCHHCHLLLI